MEITYFEDYNLLADWAFELLIGELRKKPDLLLCAATGNSPRGIYRRLTEMGKADPSLVNRLRIIKLDEWSGVSHNSRGSCESYLHTHLVEPLHIDQDRFISFRSDAPDPEKECRRIGSILEREGPVDVAVLGMGTNGHLGFNEPGSRMEPHCHLTPLTLESQQHSMMHHLRHKPAYGMTLGMSDILASSVILLIVAGKGKEEALSSLLEGKITTGCPATFLWLHERVYCMVERSSPNQLGQD
jgi:galactosamine-6-phosphate isomerase